MNSVCAVLLGLVGLAAAHYAGYPHKHINGGKYGAEFPYANYQKGYDATPVKAQAPAAAAYGAYGIPQGAGYGANQEFNYRKQSGYPVHVGRGNFYYLGSYSGTCAAGYNYGFYYAGDDRSFIVCDNGRAHRFQCPRGTKNRSITHFEQNRAYAMNELCGVNTNSH